MSARTAVAAVAPVLAVALGLAGCASSLDGRAAPDACVVSLTSNPVAPGADPTRAIEVSSQVTRAFGVLGYGWHVRFDGVEVPFVPATGGDAIDFVAATPGVYTVTLDISGASPSCPQGVASIQVGAGAGALPPELLRLRVTPPRSAATPVLEKLVAVYPGSGADEGIVNLSSGVLASPIVRGPSGGVAAYLQFAPVAAPDAIVEAFSDDAGATSVQLVAQPYAVLVTPASGGLPPRRIAGWLPGAGLTIDAGSAITGSVTGPDSALLAGAIVRLAIDGVPSTLATTSASGSFALRAASAARLDAEVTVEVTPPASSGLPRLVATSHSLDLGVPLAIRYAANLAPVELAGTIVRRGGVPVSGARVIAVGALAAAGTVTAGNQAVAAGAVRISATTDAAGALPAMAVPSTALSAVVEIAPADLAVVALDTRAGVPASLEAPPLQLVTTSAQDAAGAALPGVVLDLVPTGALAMASAPVLRSTADPTGAITANLPSGGSYQLRFWDPLARRGHRIVADAAISSIAPSYELPAAVRVQGALMRDGAQPLANASVQLLCSACSGIERERPLVEGVSDADGRFALAVPDPGTR